MKKLLALGMSILLIGCSESPVDESGRHVAERSGTNEFNVVLYSGGESGYFVTSWLMDTNTL